jgi:hypothetical protein
MPRPLLRLPIRACGLVLTATLLLLSTLPVQAQWMWRDAEGRVTASDRPPPRDIPAKDIMQRPTPQDVRRSNAVVPTAPASPAASAAAAAIGATAGATGRAGTPLEREVEARKQAEKAAAEAKAKAEDEKAMVARAENCRRARSSLATLQSGTRLVRTNERGEQEDVDDTGRAAEMARAREIIASDCR